MALFKDLQGACVDVRRAALPTLLLREIGRAARPRRLARPLSSEALANLQAGLSEAGRAGLHSTRCEVCILAEP